MELVSQLEVETLVNAAQCPTRVEQCIASKGQGLKEGYKWLVKSVISKFVDIEGRVVKDSEKENKKEEVRRENARRRIEEKRRLQEQEEEGEGEEASNSEDICPPGFVPLDDLRKRWSTQDNPVSAASNLFSNGGKAVSNQFSNGNISTSNLFSNGGMTEKVRNGNSSPNGTHFSQLRLSDLPINGSNGKLELEPIHRPKKRSLLSKLQKTNTEIKSIKSIDSQISQAWSTAEDRGGIRNWGLAEEL
ncbi:uncharacterized protein LOC111709091 [Eurytemora carolleeae]|uniref:uncharacterized protein LOC111709091 n=1 Tax=Eurytemora carolleeae TaxID=1294199 RepID=UPI000C773065|nr:uncharacterized protein LOC111709091 [Eurytemora carolleeae]|eukprot:XP_023338456.1 uncharacterized protein LOC111709091 [Eurytemora affinis]